MMGAAIRYKQQNNGKQVTSTTAPSIAKSSDNSTVMVISSPFRKSSHSGSSSKDESSGTRQPQGAPYTRTQPSPTSGSRSNSSKTVPVLKKTNTMASINSVSTSASASLAQQYENDKKRLIKYCFSSLDKDGVLTDNYITHVRVIEDAAYPSNKPPSGSSATNKKSRILALAVKKDGSVHLHKGRENPNGSFQIGRTWSLNELSKIVREPASEAGFLCTLGKDYYWETNTGRERQVFITSFVRVYRKFKNGLVPQLINWDLSLFGLDENSYKMSINKETKEAPADRKASVVSQGSNKDRSSVSQSPMISITQSPRASQQELSPKKMSSKTPLAGPAATSTPPISSSSSRQQSVSTDPYAKRPSVSEKGSSKIQAPSTSGNRRPSNPSSARKPSAAESSKRRPSDSSPYAQMPPSISTSRNMPNAPPSIQVESHSTLAQDPVPVSATTPLNVGGATRSKPAVQGSMPDDDLSPFALEQEINEQMKSLGLDTPTKVLPRSKNVREAQIALDIPPRLDAPISADSVPKSVGSQDSSAPSVSQTLKSVEIVAHRRSMLEFEEDQDSSDDDITALYHDSSDQLDSPVIRHPKDIQNVEPVPFPTSADTPSEADSQDFSFENSYDEQEVSAEHINATPRAIVTETPTTIKANNQSDNEDEYDDLNMSPVDALQVPQTRSRRRANTIDSVMDNQDSEPSSFDDIFDEINWEITDDAESLALKLMKELAETEYETTKRLIEVRGQSSNLKQHTSKIADECNKLTPLLNLFAVELSGFSRDIQHVENEGKGLQVESINKKILWSDLHTLLNTVAVDENSLDVLLKADVDRDLHVLEPVLSELESAINAIRGNEKGEEDLGDMRALRERRAKYESVIAQFLRRMRIELEKRFSYSLNNLGSNSSEKDILKSVSQLVSYAGITLFIRDMAEESFYDLVGCWESYAAPLYETIITRVNAEIVEKTKKDQKFTLSNPTAYKQAIPATVMKKVTMESKQSKLREKFGLSEPSSPMDVDQPVLPSEDNEIEQYFDSLQTVLNHVILQQNFLVKFFHMSSTEADVGKYIQKHPIQERKTLLNSSIGEIDFDRGNARDISSSIAAIFQPSLENLQKSIVQGLRNNQKNTPGVMLWIELFEKQFGSSNQEYLLGQFKKLADRLSADWIKFVGIENKSIEKITLARRNGREVSIIVQNFCTLVRETEKTFAKTLAQYPIGGGIAKNLDTGKKMDTTYVELSTSILNNLKQEFEEKFSRFKLHEASETQDKMNYLINIAQNSNWVMESLTPLRLPSMTSVLAQYQAVYKTSTEQYVHMLVDRHFGKVASFVADVDGLIQETTPKAIDPSKRNAYSKSSLSKILNNYTTRDVTKIIHDLRQELTGHLDSMSESDIQRLLLDKLWSAVQAHFVSIVVRLETIMDKFYRDTDMKFTKKDVVAAFNASRISH